ncbi:MAG: hypothetical protein CR217_16405 [Beijerinckiaceae bacterium]|nr:MAG: hypothetical protein CR217_16405 [Beijerinckiaceae bacterium]
MDGPDWQAVFLDVVNGWRLAVMLEWTAPFPWLPKGRKISGDRNDGGGLDLAKNVFQVHGIDDSGQAVLKRKLRRSEVLPLFAGLATQL